MKIKVNGRDLEVIAKTLSYEDICHLEFGKVPEALITVVHHTRAEGGWERNGSLTPGQSVELVEGMIFNAHYTGNA